MMATMDEVRARESSPDTQRQAERVVDEITRRVNGTFIAAIAKQAGRARGNQAKVILLREMTEPLAKAAKGLVPCTAGCSHCCHMGTLVSVQEAEVIAKETGRKLTMPAKFNEFSRYHADYLGVPCTMLKDGKCSIYASRPFACRIHYVVDVDNMLCEIRPGEDIIAPHINVAEYDKVYCQTFTEPHLMKFSDIREFFK